MSPDFYRTKAQHDVVLRHSSPDQLFGRPVLCAIALEPQFFIDNKAEAGPSSGLPMSTLLASRSRVRYLVRSNGYDPSIPREVYGVEREHVSNAVNFHQGHKSGIVHLNTHNTMRHDQVLHSKYAAA